MEHVFDLSESRDGIMMIQTTIKKAPLLAMPFSGYG
jgi:hypothetical protein